MTKMKCAILVFFSSILFFSPLVEAQVSAWSPSLDEAVKKSRELNLAEQRQWILLGHYKKSLLGLWKSDIADKNFFTSPEGRTTPQAELESLLAAIYAPTNESDINQDLRCRFPARLYWIKKQLNLQGPSEDQDPVLQRCAMYKRYRAVIDIHSLSFVFSSYYANSPGSAFGHTFFRLNKKPGPNGQRSELLDHGVGYAAQVTVSNPALYAIFGLAGFFEGVFTNLPYYYKVREYNDFESRDLWSYDLNLTPEEVDMVARHLWEIGNSYFDYYFFTQNCAYLMLTVIDAAAPRYHTMERVPYYVIPSDSIKALNEEPGLVTNVTFRPSIRSVFIQRYNKLDPGNQQIFRSYMQDLNLQTITAPEEERRIALLDTALDYLDVVYPENMIDTQSPGAKIKNGILMARASIPKTSEAFSPTLPEKERPDLGHNSARAAIGGGSNYLTHQAMQFEFRFALHDLLDSHQGYPEFSQLEFFNFAGQHDLETHYSRLDRFDFFRVAALNPWSIFLKKASWRIHIGAIRFLQGACETDCLAPGLGFGYGYSAFLDGSQRFLGYAMLDGQAYADVHFLGRPYKVAAGPTLGLLIKLGDPFKWSLEGGYLAQAVKQQKDAYHFSTELRYHMARQWNLGARYTHEFDSDESFLMLYRFF